MADQKALKKRLKALMNRPENQVCSDCPERQPRWASLIVPPPGAPQGSLPIGAFCCLECSGSHRRLGVHISFVRSINLDSWKEKEVLAMENGGNAKVNAIFEARLPSQSTKPSNHADGQTRERFIRDKYERRKYYDPAGFEAYAAQAAQAIPSSSSSVESGGAPRSVGPPSEAAQMRIKERRARMGKATSNVEQPQSTSRSSSRSSTGAARRKVAAAPVSAPVPTVDLLDLMGGSGGGDEQPQQEAPKQKSPSSGGLDLFDFLTSDKNIDTSYKAAGSTTAALAGSPPKQSKTSSSVSADILSLYSSGNPQQHQPQQQSPSHGFANFGMMQQQQQQQPMNNSMMGGNNPMMMGGMGYSNSSSNNNNMFMANNTGGGMHNMNNGMGNNMMMQNPNMNQMTNMMQNMQFNNNPQQQQQMYQQQQMMMMQQQQQMMHQQQNISSSNGFGNFQQQQQRPPQQRPPPKPEKEDPFAQFGSNVFRS